MFGIKTFLSGLTLGSVTSLLAMQFHVINTNDGMIVLPRVSRPPLRSTYVDVRKWSLSMWRQHPDVAKAAVMYGRPDLLGDGVLNSIFPEQAEAEMQPTGGSASDQAKLAMEALVPIKFTHPDPVPDVVTPEVSAPVFPFPLQEKSRESSLQQRETNGQHSASSRRHEELTSVVNQVFPSDFRIDESLLKGLPKLQDPIPIFDDDTRLKDLSGSSNAPRTGRETNLFTDVLRALIPGTSEAASTHGAQHGAAHETFRVEAPSPGVPQQQQTSGQLPRQPDQSPVVPVVRPF